MAMSMSVGSLPTCVAALLGAMGAAAAEAQAAAPGEVPSRSDKPAAAEQLPAMALEILCFCVACYILRLGSGGAKQKRAAAPAKTEAAPKERAAPRRAANAPEKKTRPRPANDLGPADVLRYAREGFPRSFEWSPETLARLVDECSRLERVPEMLEVASKIEDMATERRIEPLPGTYERLIAMYAQGDNERGTKCFDRMLSSGRFPSEGFCRYAMSRCADSKCVGLAVAIAGQVTRRSSMSLQTFKSLLKVYSCAGMYEQGCNVYYDMIKASVEPDAVTYGNLLRCAQKAGKTELSQELLQKSEGTGCIKTILWTIRSAGQDGDVEKAAEAFRQLKIGRSSVVDSMAYNIMIDACCSSKDMERAESFFAEMDESGIKANHVTFNIMIKGYSSIGDLDKAKEMVRSMQAQGFSPDAASYSCLLGCSARALNFPEVWRIMGKLDALGLPADSYVVAILMQACRRTEDLGEAMRVLEILDRPDVNIAADVVVYNTALDACIFRRDYARLDRAVRLFDGPSCTVQPSPRTYGLLIKSCAILGRTGDAAKMWQHMLGTGHQPNEVTLGCMIDAYIEGKRVEDALALFQEWKGRVKCDTITYSTLIKGFALISDSDRALALYQDMRTRGVPMNQVAYTALITACARSGLMKRVDDILDEMLQDGCKPNGITYSVIIRGHCVRGDLTAALDVLHRMVAAGFPADCIIYNTLLDGCVQHSNWELADTLLQEMEKQGIRHSNFTMSITVKMWSKRGDLDRAIKTVYNALKLPPSLPAKVGKRHQSSNVDAQVGSCLVGACIHNGAIEKALEIFRDMKTWPQIDGPDAHTYGAMICGMVKHGDLYEATRIVEDSLVALRGSYRGNVVQASSLRQLFRAYRSQGLLEELGKPLFKKLVDADVEVEDRWIALY